jgi:hypothetical protein
MIKMSNVEQDMMHGQAVSAARTYAFVGFIFYIISTIMGLIGFLVVRFFLRVISGATSPGVIVPPRFFLVSVIFLLLSIPGIILSIFAWITVRNIDRGRYSQARTYSLILGIIGLFYGLISGILFLLAYSKLSETTTNRISGSAIQPPPTTQATPQRFCANCGRAASVDARFCTNCGKQLPPSHHRISQSKRVRINGRFNFKERGKEKESEEKKTGAIQESARELVRQQSKNGICQRTS